MKKLTYIENPDKKFHEKIDPSNLGNLPHPFKCLMCGSTNSGKTMLILNLILEQSPDFDRIILYHVDGEVSEEYNLIDAELVTSIPPISEIDASIKNLIIFEDICYKNLKKDQKALLDRYLGYVSTHKNVSVILTCQEPTATDANNRRMLTHTFVWDFPDQQGQLLAGRLVGLKRPQYESVFKYVCNEPYCSLLLDIKNKEYKYRKNLFEVIDVSKYL